MNVQLRRRAQFSAAHNYWMESLTDEQNRDLFGKWASCRSHGHNYDVEVAVSGPVDESTGMVVNIVEIDRIIKAEITGKLDGRHLSTDVAYFENRPTTLENVTLYCWEHIAPHLPAHLSLDAVRVWEMPTLWASRTFKDGTMQVSLTRKYDFAASHRLHSSSLSDQENLTLFGKCNNPHGHGHNYEVEVTLTGEPDPRSGMLFGLEELDEVVGDEVLTAFDHKHLNLDTPEFADVNPTSEMLTVVIWNKLARRLPVEGRVRLSGVVVHETARNSFAYSGI